MDRDVGDQRQHERGQRRMSDSSNSAPPAQLSGLRARLADPEARLLAAFVGVPRVEIVQIIGLGGFDLVILDGEHGAFDPSAMAALVAAGHGVGLHVIARVPELRAQAISAALDAGADGVLVPHVRDAAEARAAVDACRFPPEGIRSVHGAVPAARYGFRPDYLSAANTDSACIVMCEDAQALEHLDEVVAVPGLDAVFVGSFDLSASMGHVGQPGHEAVVAASRRVLQAASGAGIAMGVMAAEPGATPSWFEAGARFVAAGVDTAMMRAGTQATVAATRAGASG